MKKRIFGKGTLFFLLVIVLQIGGFVFLNMFLAPDADQTVTTFASVQTTGGQESDEWMRPERAVLLDVDERKNTIAYIDRNERLFIRNKKGRTLAMQSLTGVHTLKWMDNGKTVFYMRERGGRNEFGVYKVLEQKLMPLYDIQLREVDVLQVYNSSYTQSIQLLFRQRETYYIGYYDAVGGYRFTQLRYEPSDWWFDEKQDLLYLRDEDGIAREYANGRLAHAKQPTPPPIVK